MKNRILIFILLISILGNAGRMVDFKTSYGILPDTISVVRKLHETRASAIIPIETVFVKGGTFKMGCTNEHYNCDEDERPAHEVTISSFRIGKTKVTVAQFAQFVEETRYKTQDEIDGKGYVYVNGVWREERGVTWKEDVAGNNYTQSLMSCNYPVIRVSWYDAKAFCDWVGARLPTEAEWEYAARGGINSSNYPYAGGDKIDELGWSENNSNYLTHEVALKKPNSLGLYDMTGNVWEWCSDWYSADYYGSSPKTDPTGENNNRGNKSIRGGSWGNKPSFCRITNRDYGVPEISCNNLGFRVVFSQ